MNWIGRLKNWYYTRYMRKFIKTFWDSQKPMPPDIAKGTYEIINNWDKESSNETHN